MKKILSMLLALTMVFSLAACGGNNAEPTEPSTEAPTDAPAAAMPESALALLEELWEMQQEKFPVFGGDATNMVNDAPGAYGLEDTETLAVQLLVPAEQAATIDEAASLFHGMMLNNFSCGAFHTSDAEALANAISNKMQNNQWMCGFPEKGFVATLGGEYVVMAFGLQQVIDPMAANLQAAYPDTQFVFNDAIV